MTCKRSPICDGTIHSAHFNNCGDECKPCPDCQDTTSDVEGMVKELGESFSPDDLTTALTRAHEQGYDTGKVVGRKEAGDVVSCGVDIDGDVCDCCQANFNAIDDIDREGK